MDINLNSNQKNFLVTLDNDPLSQNGGLYFLVKDFLGRIYVRINLRAEEPVKRKSEHEFIFKNIDTLAYLGGHDTDDQISLLHDALSNFDQSESIHNPFVSITGFDEIAHKGSFQHPRFKKIIKGCTLLKYSEIEENVKNGNWIEVQAPSVIAYSEKDESLTEIALKYRTDREIDSKSSIFQAFKNFINPLQSSVLDVNLAIVRTVVRHTLTSKRTISNDEIERTLEAHIGVMSFETDEITDLMEKYQEEEILEKFKTIEKGYYKLPIAKRNQEIRNMFSELKLSREPYDYLIFDAYMKDTQKIVESTKTDSGAASRGLEEKIERTADIVKGQDR